MTAIAQRHEVDLVQASGGVMPALIVVALQVSRLLGRYWAEWAIGAIGIVLITFRGRTIERVLLGTIVLESLAAGGGQLALGFRGTLFIALFMALARYSRINPWLALGTQLFALLVSLTDGSDVLPELFLYGPCVLLLIISNEMIRDAVPRSRLLRYCVVGLANLLAFTIPTLGNGSRSALFVWITVNARRIKPIYFVVIAMIALAAVPVLLTFRDVPIVQKLNNSINELGEPIDPETGSVSQRAIENLTFLEYVTSATRREILFGSTVPILLDGEPLGQDKDVRFVPHNQVFGMIFQFGLVGSFVFIYYLVGLCRYYYADRFVGFTFLMLLLPSFVLKGGVYDADLAMLAGTLNWVRHRQFMRLAQAGPVRRMPPSPANHQPARFTTAATADTSVIG